MTKIIENVRDPTLKAISKYRKHPRILAIKRKTKSGPVFTFNNITKEDVIKEIKSFTRPKASQDACIFPTSLKLANIAPVYKRKLKEFKGKFSSAGILLNISKFTKGVFF